MGNVCQNDVLRAELSSFMGLKQVPWHSVDPSGKDPQETASSFHRASMKQGVKKPKLHHGPSPAEGYYMEMPTLLQPVSQRLPQMISLKEASSLNGREFHGPFKFFEVDMVYMGEWQSGKPNGKGRAYYSDGSVYDGEFHCGVPTGYGKYVIPNGDYYEGDVYLGQAHGTGTYTTSNSTFRGLFVNDMREGWGIQQTNDYCFQGIFKMGERRSGTLIWGDCKYVGEFVNDTFEGKGCIVTEEGTYTGDFQAGKKHGFGLFVWQDGTTYRGHYEHDYRKGEGMYLSSTGEVLSVVTEIEI